MFGKCSEMFGTGGCPPTHPSPAVAISPKMFKCSEHVQKPFGTGGPPPPHLPRDSGSPENVQKTFGDCSELLGCLSSTPPPGWWFPRQCAENVRGIFGTGGCLLPPSPPPRSSGGGSPENVRRMFGKCLELVGVPSPHLPRGGAPPLKCSENVRKMSGTGGCPSPPLPRDGGSPENVRTMS
jgi:hypothetical protein